MRQRWSLGYETKEGTRSLAPFPLTVIDANGSPELSELLDEWIPSRADEVRKEKQAAPVKRVRRRKLKAKPKS